MSDELHSHGCDNYADDLAALALGALTGRERATVLAHVETCPRCADELEQLVRAADAVVRVAPEREPPLGFESRLFSRMGVVDAVPIARRRFTPPRWALAAAALVAALGIGLGVGLSSGSKSGTTQAIIRTPRGTPVATADLTENGVDVGQVFTYGGSTPWMFMTLADSSAHGRVICKVVTADGVSHQVGAFTATKNGYGAWGAPLPVTPQDVRRAEVVSPNGTVIASATLS
ncbi:MAG TPA: zf-HC2 domain-containing protein [Acidimicrobiales bacterium]|jgi:hypothetical protein|nr:zf-HC2 domain-containing protein [Acidimicrobiales bacterium]